MMSDKFTHYIVVDREIRGRAVVKYTHGNQSYCIYRFVDEDEEICGLIPSKLLVEIWKFHQLFRVNGYKIEEFQRVG